MERVVVVRVGPQIFNPEMISRSSMTHPPSHVYPDLFCCLVSMLATFCKAAASELSMRRPATTVVPSSPIAS